MLSHPRLSVQKSRFIQDMALASSFPSLAHSVQRAAPTASAVCVLLDSSITEDSCRVLVPRFLPGISQSLTCTNADPAEQIKEARGDN